MSKQHIRIIAALSALGLASAYANQNSPTSPGTPPSDAANQSASSTTASTISSQTASGQSEIQLATTVIEEMSVEELKGKKVTGSDQAELGKIEDFVVDTRSGKIAHAVVSSGGMLGFGGDLRLVPQTSLKASTTGEEFTAHYDKTSFEALPVVAKNDLESKRNAAGSERNREPAAEQSDERQAQASASADSPTASPQEGTPSPAAEIQNARHLVLASQLEGKSVQAAGKDAGKIEGVTLNVQEWTAAALFKPEEEFAGTDATFKVPFSSFQFAGSEQDTVATTLNRNAFAQVQSVAGTTSQMADVNTETSRSPTGRDSSATYATTPASSASSTDRTGDTVERSTSETRTDLAANAEETRAATTATEETGAAQKQTSEVLASSDTQTSTALEQPSTTTDPSITAARTDEPAINDNTQGTIAASNASASAARETDQALTPTGRGDSSQEATLAAATSAIRSALSNDAEISREQIEVKHSDGKITLEGEVDSEAAKRRVESIAKVAADGAEIDNRIEVIEK